MFITLEGIEGAGKTTQIDAMVAFLNTAGCEAVATREPGGTLIGQKIRSILLDPENKEIDPVAELLLYTADRVQHVKQVVAPLLAAGKTVICDRYYDATVVYQGFARGLDIGLIDDLHRLALKGLKPDITFLLDLSPEIGLARAWEQIGQGARTGLETRFEQETLAFHQKVRSGYLELARREPGRFRVVDAAQDQRQVQKAVIDILAKVMNLD